MTPTPPDKTPEITQDLTPPEDDMLCMNCQYGEWRHGKDGLACKNFDNGLTPPDKDEIDEILLGLDLGDASEGLRVLLEKESMNSKNFQRAKQAINRLITQSNKDLLERVRSEVIGEDETISSNAKWGDSWLERNRLRAEQRSALQKIEEFITQSRIPKSPSL